MSSTEWVGSQRGPIHFIPDPPQKGYRPDTGTKKIEDRGYGRTCAACGQTFRYPLKDSKGWTWQGCLATCPECSKALPVTT